MDPRRTFPVGSWVRWAGPPVSYGHGEVREGMAGVVRHPATPPFQDFSVLFRGLEGPVWVEAGDVVPAEPGEEDLAWWIERLLSQ